GFFNYFILLFFIYLYFYIYKELLADIAEQTENVFALDILNDYHKILLNKLANPRNFIEDPSKVFQHFITEKSTSTVNLQVEKHKANILRAFKHHHYPIVQTKLDELINLQSVLKTKHTFEYLSCRDFKSFEPLFNAFGVVDHIHYGTFNKLCERIINEGGDVRKLVENLIIPNDEKKIAETPRVTRARVLLIDEVDVFFNKEFYVKCCKLLHGWDKLLDEAIKDMLSDVQTFKSHGYQVSNNKIG
ncbi:hypothetical protein RFI_24871, partial [Reticulomyxa filosa]